VCTLVLRWGVVLGRRGWVCECGCGWWCGVVWCTTGKLTVAAIPFSLSPPFHTHTHAHAHAHTHNPVAPFQPRSQPLRPAPARSLAPAGACSPRRMHCYGDCLQAGARSPSSRLQLSSARFRIIGYGAVNRDHARKFWGTAANNFFTKHHNNTTTCEGRSWESALLSTRGTQFS
jgi:hypothetical protein